MKCSSSAWASRLKTAEMGQDLDSARHLPILHVHSDMTAPSQFYGFSACPSGLPNLPTACIKIALPSTPAMQTPCPPVLLLSHISQPMPWNTCRLKASTSLALEIPTCPSIWETLRGSDRSYWITLSFSKCCKALGRLLITRPVTTKCALPRLQEQLVWRLAGRAMERGIFILAELTVQLPRASISSWGRGEDRSGSESAAANKSNWMTLPWQFFYPQIWNPGTSSILLTDEWCLLIG